MQTDRIPIAVVVPTKNEERNIEKCLEALRPFGQVVVVDSESSDRTCALAEANGAEVVNYHWDGKYPKKKQWCLDNLDLKSDWVLFVDADETPDDDLISEIRHLVHRDMIDRFDAYDIRLNYLFLGRELRHGHQVVKRVLVNRKRTRFPTLLDLDAPGMGEQEGHYQPVVDGEVGQMDGKMNHEDRDPFSAWLNRHNRYSEWECYLEQHPELSNQVRALRSSRGRRYRHTPLKPAAFFIYSYVLRRGFLDGSAGFHYAMAHAFYYWQIGVKNIEAQLHNAKESARTTP